MVLVVSASGIFATILYPIRIVLCFARVFLSWFRFCQEEMLLEGWVWCLGSSSGARTSSWSEPMLSDKGEGKGLDIPSLSWNYSEAISATLFSGISTPPTYLCVPHFPFSWTRSRTKTYFRPRANLAIIFWKKISFSKCRFSYIASLTSSLSRGPPLMTPRAHPPHRKPVPGSQILAHPWHLQLFLIMTQPHRRNLPHRTDRLFFSPTFHVTLRRALNNWEGERAMATTRRPFPASESPK
jgi:hypothetical protein